MDPHRFAQPQMLHSSLEITSHSIFDTHCKQRHHKQQQQRQITLPLPNTVCNASNYSLPVLHRVADV